MHINIQSLNLKILNLGVLLNEVAPEILCLTEHWLRNDGIEKVNLNNYKLSSYSSRTNNRAGGTALYGLNNFDLRKVELDIDSLDFDCEFCVSRCQMGVFKCYVVCMYKAPTGNFDLFFAKTHEILNKIYSSEKNIIVCGDFNLNFAHPNANVNSLLQLFLSYGLEPHINEITRHGPVSGSQIDNIFSNLHYKDLQSYVLTRDISDHYPQIIKFPVHPFTQPVRFIKNRFFTQENINNFKILLQSEDWSEIINQCGVDNKFDTFFNIFSYYFDLSFPMSSSREILNKESWVNKEIKEYSQYINDLYILKKQSQSPELNNHYKCERKKYRKFLRNYKKSINDNKILNSTNKTKMSWSIVNNVTNKGKSQTTKCFRNEQGDLENDPSIVANMFGAHFDLGYQQTSLGRTQPQNLCCDSFFFFPTDAQEVISIIINLPNKYAAGMDEVPVFVLKHVAEYIGQPLADIINECFTCGVFPSNLKNAKVIPVFKKGSTQIINNYRPVSLPPAISKVFERSMYNRLMAFIKKNSILTPQQYGFRPNMSTELAIFKTINYIVEKIDKGEKVAGLCFDLSKAFDTINHLLLICKLDGYGIRGIPALLIKSYLTSRRQTVCFRQSDKEYFSNTVELHQGVPQGSILGPLLFLLYVNDLGSMGASGLTCQYADDTSVILAGPDLGALSQDCSCAAEEMSLWCKANNLNLNASKTGLLQFCNLTMPDESIYIKLNHRSVPVSDNVKFLGVIMDPALSWDAHIDGLASKLSSLCWVVRRLRDQLFLDTVRVFYFASIQSLINYGIVFWGSSKHSIKIFKCQKRIIRCMFHLHPRTSCKPFFARLAVLTVPSLYFLSLVNFVKKYPHLFSTNAECYSGCMSVVTRNRDSLCIPMHNTSYFQRGPLYRAIKAYKMLPISIREITNFTKFRNLVINYLLEKCFYSFNFEF